MNKAKIQAWLRQPSTISGIATLVGGTAALGVCAIFGVTPPSTITIGGLAYAAVQLVMNDNTATPPASGS